MCTQYDIRALKICKRKESPYMKDGIAVCGFSLSPISKVSLSRRERAADRMPNIIAGFQGTPHSGVAIFYFLFLMFCTIRQNTPGPPPLPFLVTLLFFSLTFAGRFMT
jgi:hypothetical protein